MIEFVEFIEHMSFWETLSNLAHEAGIPIPKLTPEYENRVKEIRQVEAVLQETAEFYHKNLPEEAKEYLISERGFTEKTIERFQIGYANGGLRSHLVENPKYSLEACLKAGVLKREDNGEIRDYFYRRIIFPNIKRGRVVHLTGRSLDGKKPKYLHLPGEMQYLYNEDALIGRNVLIGEGPTDAISAEQAGIPTVAVLGSNSKPKFVSKFSQVEVVYIALDGDDAGKKGILKIAEPFGAKAKIIELPKGNDLNDYFRAHSKEDFKKLAVNAKDLVEYQVSIIPASIKKIDLPKKLEPVLKKLACMDKVKIEAYLDEIKKQFKLKKPYVDGYRELINKYRQEKSKHLNIKASNSNNEKCYTASFEGLVDIVEHEGNPAFLIKEGKALSIQLEFDRDGVICIPPPRENIPWMLPRGEEVLKYYDERNELTQKELDEQLYCDLLVYHVDISELPSEEYYDLLVAWDMHTYLQEQLQYSPIINLFAVPERGKTRTGQGMIFVAFRGIHVECLREAYIIRVTNDLHASIFFDVMDIWRKLEKYRSEDILLQRYEKGAIAPRVLYPEKGAHRDIVYYSIFGPTIVGTNRAIHKILDTRSVQINMPETKNQYEKAVTPEIALDLKERLVAFRAAHLGESLPEVSKPAKGRLGDILKPLQQIICLACPEREGSFLKLVKEIESGRLTEKADSYEAEILRVVYSLKNSVNKGLLSIKEITTTYNEGKSDRSQRTNSSIGKTLASIGFKKSRGMADGSTAIIWNEEKIEQMVDSYGLRKASEGSEASVNTSESTSATEETEASEEKSEGV